MKKKKARDKKKPVVKKKAPVEIPVTNELQSEEVIEVETPGEPPDEPEAKPGFFEKIFG
jgi:hypothetical protein